MTSRPGTGKGSDAARPIHIWPLRRSSGRAGYSAAHFELLRNGQPDTPLLVAARIADRRRVPDAERQACWERLCSDLDAVILELERCANEPGIKSFLRQAKAAKRRLEE